MARLDTEVRERRGQQAFRHKATIAAVDLFPVRSTGGNSPSMVLGMMPTRPALLVRLTDSDGAIGWGEIWANFPPRANIHKAHLVEDVVAPKLVGAGFVEPREFTDQLRAELSTYFVHIGQPQVLEHILAGLDCALWDLALRGHGRSFATHMGLPTASAHTYASSINPPDLDRLLPLHARFGQWYFKLKVGFDDATDRAFVERASALCPSGARVLIDANQSWDTGRALAMVQSLEDVRLGFVEEPIRADAPLSEWQALADAVRTPLAAGENVYGAQAFMDLADAGVRYLQPDVAKWGGVSGALELDRYLPDGVELWPHFMGTAIGQMAALSGTAAVGEGSVCEMDVNDNTLRTALCGDVLGIEDGTVALPADIGLVMPPNASKLSKFTEGTG